jgi:hypothetical protein
MLGGGTILRRMRTKSDEDLRWWRHAAKRRYALGSGGWLSFAPQFPKWIERPGIWDEAHVHNAAFAPVHSYALLDEEMRLIPLRFVSRAWRPDVLSLYFEGEFDGSALFVEERRKITPGDAIRSRLRIKGTTGRMLWIVAWTCVPADLELERRKGRYRFRRELQSYRFPAVPVDVEFGGDDFKLLRPRWIQGELPAPDFELTPYFDELPRLPLLESGERIEAPEQLPSRASIVLGCAQRFVLSKERLAVATVETRLRVRTERADAAKVFAPTRHSEFVELLPQLDSDDARVDELYGHRQWLLHFLRVPGGRGHIAEPAVCEGLGFFREPISYSAHAIARDARWLRDPKLARGCIEAFLRARHPSGQVPGRLYLESLEGTDFYFADWAGALESVDALHPSPRWRARVLSGLADYSDWLGNERDRKRTGLCEVRSHYETGQEYNRRYTEVDPAADREDWAEHFRLLGVDASVYRWLLLELMTGARLDGAKELLAKSGAAIAGLWDEEAGFFFDRDPKAKRLVPVRVVTGFYPLLTDLPEPEQIGRLLDALEDPQDFGLPFPVPSVSKQDPLFDPDARWKDVRRVCPWNGRSWPMTNSHVFEGLLRTSERDDLSPELRERCRARAAALLDRTVAMLSGEGHGPGPHSYEHYHPVTGRPCRYRGVDDYLHAWVLDHMLGGFCGLRPDKNGLSVHPLAPEGCDFELRACTCEVGNSACAGRTGAYLCGMGAT